MCVSHGGTVGGMAGWVGEGVEMEVCMGSLFRPETPSHLPTTTGHSSFTLLLSFSLRIHSSTVTTVSPS